MSEVGSSDSNYDYYQKALGDLQDSYRQNTKRSEDAQKEELDRVRAANTKQNEKKEQEIAERVDRVRDEAYQRHVQSRAERQAEIDELKKQSYDKSGKFTAADGEELNRKIASLQTALTEMDKSQQGKDGLAETKAAERERQMLRQMDQNTENLRESHAQETRILREQMRDASTVDRSIKKEMSKGRQEAYKDVENDLRMQNKVTADAYEDQLQAVKLRSKEQDRYFAQVNDNNMKERGRYYTGLLGEIGKGYSEDRKELAGQFDKASNELKQRYDKGQAQTEKAYLQAIEKSDARRQTDLENQAKSFQTTGRLQKEASNAETRQLQKELQAARTSPSLEGISPAAEEHVRTQIYDQVARQKLAENDSKEEALETMREGYNRRMQEMVADHKDGTTKQMKAITKERDLDRQTYLTSLYTSEKDKAEQLRDREIQVNRDNLIANRNRAQQMQQIERELSGGIDRAREDGQMRVADVREEFNLAAMNKLRDTNDRYNDAVRSYERKLADQKFETDQRLQDTVSEMKNRLMDSERQAKRSLEEQAKGYDRRFAQLEQSSKERERTVAQNYENELEKVKRANALLVQKKS